MAHRIKHPYVVGYRHKNGFLSTQKSACEYPIRSVAESLGLELRKYFKILRKGKKITTYKIIVEQKRPTRDFNQGELYYENQSQ